MVRGAQRKMIVMKTTDSEFFEEAYFLLKPRAAESEEGEGADMVSEANRILGHCLGRRSPRVRRGRGAIFHRAGIGDILPFLLGIAVGALVGALFFL